MKNLNEILLEEVKSFRKLGHKFLNGEVSKMDFKGASGGMGVYAHRSGKEFMIRFRIPSGIANRKDLELIYDFAKRYELQWIHLTTRQAIQLHGISIDEVCDAMEEGINKGLYSRGSGGNFPRNVAISPLSGVDKDEAFDVSPYALAVGNYFLNKVYTYKLPRKLKVAFSNNDRDFPHAGAVDLGFFAVREGDKEYFKAYLGGGLGRNSRVGVEFPELITPEDVLYHVEAMTQLFIDEGDYKNKNKARIRYIVERMGKEEFIQCYKKHLEEVTQANKLKISVEEKVYDKPGIETLVQSKRLVEQKQKGLYSVYVHPIGGQLSIGDFKLILDETENIQDSEIRLAMTEGLYIRNLDGKEAGKMLDITEHIGGENRLEQSIACIGVPTCQMGILDSQKVLREIIIYFREKNFLEDVLPIIHISGCPNSCSAHEIGGIGFCGKKKNVNGQIQEVFEVHLGGKLGIGKAILADYYGDILRERLPEFLYEIALELKEKNQDFYEWVERNQCDMKKILYKYRV